ncbi:MAG: DUF5050 domain-containing protein [Clostridiales bacterium]|jgi:hypothetical protein|nr:DUF5050 domain-containing protein [Clostridiales bacterium]
MKKKLIAILAAALAAAFILTACGSFPSIKVERVPDANAVVTSNGGQVVQVDDYIYFVNGKKDTADAEGTNNIWGSVVRGGIYQAKLADGTSEIAKHDRVYGDYKVKEVTGEQFGAHSEDEDFSGFVMQSVTIFEETDDEEVVQIVDARPVVNKLVTYGSDTGNNGLYIFDGWIYFTSPSNLKDRLGVVQYDHVSFYRTRLNGGGSQLLYTAKGTTAPQYGYYHYDGALYLTVFDTDGAATPVNNIYSVKINGGRVSKAQIIAENITAATFQKRSVYVPGAAAENYVDDFIYYTRAFNKDYDNITTGNIMERVRPNGASDTRLKLYNGGNSIELLSVSPDALYYYDSNAAATVKTLYANDMKGVPLDKTRISSEEENVFIAAADSSWAPVTLIKDARSLTNVYADIYYSGNPDNIAAGTFFAVANRGSNTVCIIANRSEETVIIAGTAVKVIVREGNDFYYSSGGAFFRANLFEEKQTPPKVVSASSIVADYFTPIDLAGGFVFFTIVTAENVGYPDNGVANYLASHRIGGNIDEKEWQISVIDPSEIPEDTEETAE